MDFDEAARQRRDPDSLLTFVSKLMHARREAPEFGWGTSTAARERAARAVRPPLRVGGLDA